MTPDIDHIELTTVGIDVGSATTHLAQDLSPVVVKSLLFAGPKDEPGAVPGHAMAGLEGGQAR